MPALFIAVVLLGLLLLFFQDIKYREIHFLLPVVVFAAAMGQLHLKGTLSYVIPVYNITFFMFIFSLLILYMSVKNKSFLNPFAHYFGLGDLLYFIAIAPFFLLHNYILFFIFSMLFSIALQFGLQKWMHKDTVPLAGFSALLLVLVLSRDLLFDFDKFTLII